MCSSSFIRCAGLLLVSGLCLFAGFPAAAQMTNATLLEGQYEVLVKDCQDQIQQGKADQCVTALKGLDAQVNNTETDAMRDLKTRLGIRISLAEAHKAAGAYTVERPDLYYRTLFKAYASVPEKYFPYEEVLPIFNLYLREDAGRSKFARYRKLKVILHAQKDDKELENDFFKQVQERLLEFGYSFMDPTSAASSRPDTLLKVDIKGEVPAVITDPRLQGKKVYRLEMDISTFRFVNSDKKIEPIEEELEVGTNFAEVSREQAIQNGCNRMTNLLFYHTLREMFHAGTSE